VCERDKVCVCECVSVCMTAPIYFECKDLVCKRQSVCVCVFVCQCVCVCV